MTGRIFEKWNAAVKIAQGIEQFLLWRNERVRDYAVAFSAPTVSVRALAEALTGRRNLFQASLARYS
jgi:hypothetical protein